MRAKAFAPLLCLLWAAAAPAGERVALVVASDTGLPNEAPLRYTSADAARVAAVLTELGGFEAADVELLVGASAEQIVAALERLAKRPRKAELFFFYYSGHADSAALHPSGTLLPVEELLARTRAVPARLELDVLDACQSGGATRPKGAQAGSPFEVRLDQATAEGRILISSSAADEQSFESDALRGALFTMNWTAGLRGAADRDNDSRVSLSEAYSYAHSQTLRASLLASSGPQHPTFRWELSGQRDPVLTRLSTSAQVTFAADEEGSYVVFDGHEQVIAELPVRAGERKRLALAPGLYAVSKRGRREVRWARISLAEHDDRLLYDYQMHAVPLVRLAKKGVLTNTWAVASAGQIATTLGPDGFMAASGGVEWEQERWLFAAQLFVSAGTEINGPQPDGRLTTHELLVGPALDALYTLRWGPVALRAGPRLAPLLVSQRVEGQPGRLGTAVVAAARLRLDVAIGAGFGVVGSADFGGLFARAEGGAPQRFQVDLGGKVTALAWADYFVGARFAW